MTTIPQAFDLAVRSHQAGDLPKAEQIYRQILQVSPGHVGALHLLGVIAHQVGRNDLAIEYMRQAVRLQPNFAEAHNHLGIVLRIQGQPAEAVRHHQQAVALRPDWPEAHLNLGIALKELGQMEEAVGSYQQAIRLRPNYAEAFNNLGNVLVVQGKLHEAIGCYQEALHLKPDYADALNNLGVALKEQQAQEAVASLQRAIDQRPDCIEAHNNLGVILTQQGRLDEAVASFQQAIRLQPDDVEVHNNLGVVLLKQGKLDEALTCFQRTVQRLPDYAECQNNLGVVLLKQGKLDEAAACFRHALRLKPNYVEAHTNFGMTCYEQGNLDEAIRSFERALVIEPDYTEAHWNRGLAWLVQGNFEQGWPEFEWQWKKNDPSRRRFQQPLWDGSPLDGRTILLHAEQGFGDTLHFIRYASVVKALGGKVIVECPASLFRLLASCPGIDHLAAEGSALPAFDVQAPLPRLPVLLRTTLATIPADVPYLFADPILVEHWRRELSTLPDFKIGIVWQGNPVQRRDRQRSVPLAAFAPLAKVPGVQLVSLQKGPGSEQLRQVTDRFDVIDLGGKTSADFMETAAIVKSLDLIVAVDTSVAHLAGALGAPVWVAVAFAPDWRYLLEREDNPWYPTMRLFRQTELGSWQPVFERMADALKEILKTRRVV